jgi:hypothetical protein
VNAAPEELVDLLRKAADAVDQADVPQDLRGIAYSRALDRLGVDAPPELNGSTASNGAAGPLNGASVCEEVERIARKLGVDPDRVARVVDVDDDGVHLTVPRSALPPVKLEAMQQIARLVSAARQAAGLDGEYTPLATIRDACDNRGVLDRNFSSAMQRLDGDGMRFRGPSRSREVKVNAAGYEAAGAIVRRLTSA